MKTLIIVNGPPGVGKTVVCEQLYRQIDHSVWLDGDWCWLMNPFVVNDENKRMVEDNITHQLRNFLKNSTLETVIFSWVIPRPAVFDKILAPLKDLEFRLFRVTLTCSEDEYRRRMAAGGREINKVEDRVSSLAGYREMDTVQVDTTEISAAEVAGAIMEMVKS